jgi:hypothetical protein
MAIDPPIAPDGALSPTTSPTSEMQQNMPFPLGPGDRLLLLKSLG